MLNIEEGNPLANRKFRNHFEHYDERIEDWFENHSSVVYSDFAMNPSLRGSFSISDHRGYNLFNNTLVFRGEILNLNEISEALEEILRNCKPFVLR